MKKFLIFYFLFFSLFSVAQKNYKNFKVSVYSRSYETQKMGDLNYIQPIWDEITRQVKVDKIYLETHRDLLIVDDETLNKAKDFFKKRGVETAGGITLTVNERNNFETFCYTNPEHRKKVKEIVEHTAKHFNELILDDFFFTSCKCDLCIAAKGDQSWTDYRLELMRKAATELVINPARAVNPNIKVVIKYPNWYEHFQGLGFNLEAQPGLFDGVYTGTETRDPSGSQHLQAYHGYSIMRYFENLKPGGNGGGWVDTGGIGDYDRYGEQLWLTLFAKAPEITLFDIRQLQRAIDKNNRAPWQNLACSFDFDEMMEPTVDSNNKMVVPSTIARAAGYTFEKVDKFMGELGNPVGVKCYKPYHSTGEDFLQSYLGMVGIPMDIVPEFPVDEPMILLTESAKFDTGIVSKIKKQLMDGKEVMITSGLLKALNGKGIEDIAEIRCSDKKALVDNFKIGWFGQASIDKKILIPQIHYLTNDSWESISALDGTNGWPILHWAGYSTGKLWVLTIPDNFTDMYLFPNEVLTGIKKVLAKHLPVVLDGPGLTSLFVYDNNTVIVESFADEVIDVKLLTDKKITTLVDINSKNEIKPTEIPPVTGMFRMPETQAVYNVKLMPHSFKVFKMNQ